MHLAHQLSTIRAGKPKETKMTRARREQLERDLKLKNKALRQRGESQWTFEHYVDWLTGKIPKYQPNPNSSFSWKASTSPRTGASRTAEIGSHKSNLGSACTKNEPKLYTGSLVKGISTLHKSNAVPVISKEEMVDISRMRR